MTGSFGDPSLFLVRTLFELVIFVLFARYFLQLFRASFYNPVTQAIVRITDPLLNPLRMFIPAAGRHDLASLVLIVILLFAMVATLSYLQGAVLNATGLTLSALYFGFLTATNLFFWTVLFRAIASWIGNSRSPAVSFLEDLTEPVVAPVRRFMPQLGGIDLSPLVVLLGISLLQMIVGNLLLG